jgi:hypothetical protein
MGNSHKNLRLKPFAQLAKFGSNSATGSRQDGFYVNFP